MRVRSGYSFRVAVGHLPDVMARLKAIKAPAAPLTDRCSTFGFNRWTKLAKGAGLRPIYGVELAVTPALGEKKPVLDYWTFLAKDSLRSLHELIALATSNPGKEPSVLYKQALAAVGLIKISGERTLLDHADPRAKDFFVGLSPSMPKALFNVAKKRGFKFVATSDNYYPNAEDQEFYRVALGHRANTQTYPMYLLSDTEWKKSVEWFADKATIQQSLKNRNAVLTSCQATMQHAHLLTPEKKFTLRQMCEAGAKKLKCNLNDPVYKARLTRELDLIAEKKFEDYFYIISDLVNWAKQRMIVGPARGSSCGSLVCYLLGITTIDPVPFNLIFERFIDTTRSDLPDIDIDFSDTRRHLVFEYAEKLYGSDHVARLGTVGLFKPRSALKQAGGALRIPSWRVEKVLEGVIERSSGDSRAMFALEDTLKGTEEGRKLLGEFPNVLMASRMEGHPNNASQHAAGIVITDAPVTEYVAVDMRTGAVMADKKDAEDLNLLKIDALGLTQLSIFERTLQLIGQKGVNGYLEKLPLNDKKAFEVLNRGHFAGVFQFTGQALRSVTQQVKITNIEDMIALTALARPGPLGTGGALAWVRRKNGTEEVTTIHPLLTDLTKESYGIIAYQEQVMQIMRQIGGFNWEDTSAIRKAMSGRLGDEFFERYHHSFIKGAVKNKVIAGVAEDIWKQVNSFGAWAFNRSHAVAYGIMSYYSCWLKAHHPVEFAAATLDSENDPAKQVALLRELREEGISYVAVDQDRSTDRWTPVEVRGKKTLVGPLTLIKGFGPATVNEVLDARASGRELRATVRKRLEDARTEIDTLFPVADSVRKLYPDLTKIKIYTEPTPIIDVQCGFKGEVMIIGAVIKIVPIDENEPVRVMKRKGKVYTYGPLQALNLFFQDDTDQIFAKIDRFKYQALGVPVFEHGRAGKAIYAVKGTVPRDFRMISVTAIRYIGEIQDCGGPTNVRTEELHTGSE